MVLPHPCVPAPESRVVSDGLWRCLWTPRMPRTRIRSCNHAKHNEHTKGEFQCTTAARCFERSQEVTEGGRGHTFALRSRHFLQASEARWLRKGVGERKKMQSPSGPGSIPARYSSYS